MSTAIGIIGGADGPTAILVAGDPAATFLWVGGILVLVFLAVLFFRRKK